MADKAAVTLFLAGFLPLAADEFAVTTSVLQYQKLQL
jgi:hypothetical protein